MIIKFIKIITINKTYYKEFGDSNPLKEKDFYKIMDIQQNIFIINSENVMDPKNYARPFLLFSKQRNSKKIPWTVPFIKYWWV